MSRIFCVLKNTERLPSRPFPVQGKSGKVYGHALPDRSKGGHVIRFPWETLKEIGPDIAAHSDMPMCKWALCDIEIEADELSEAKLADELDQQKAKVAELEIALQRVAQERDDAVRALVGKVMPLEDRTAEIDLKQSQIATIEVPETNPDTAPEQQPEPEKEPEPETPYGEHTAESLKAIENFRDLRKIAIALGVAGADKTTSRASLEKGILARQEELKATPPAHESTNE